MLLIDGVRYELWTPPTEDEFEKVVEKHAEDIFGKDAKYFDLKHKLASRSGTGSIPDGYVIALGDKPKVQIIEFELESHTLQHIVSQMVNIINGIENSTTQQKICNAIEDGINEDEIFAAKIAKAIKPVAIHRFLSDSFSNTLPTINIIIDQSWSALDEAVRKISPPPKIIEFQTYTREGIGLPVHAHLFKPLYEQKKVAVSGEEVKHEKPNKSPRNELYRQFFGELVERYSSQNPSWKRIKALPQSYLGFGAGKSGLWFYWAFKSNKRFSVELYIDTGDKGKNKSYFDKIKLSEERIKSSLSLETYWERLDEKKASRIALYAKGDIDEAMKDNKEKERLIKWSIIAMKSFADILKDCIANL